MVSQTSASQTTSFQHWVFNYLFHFRSVKEDTLRWDCRCFAFVHNRFWFFTDFCLFLLGFFCCCSGLFLEDKTQSSSLGLMQRQHVLILKNIFVTFKIHHQLYEGTLALIWKQKSAQSSVVVAQSWLLTFFSMKYREVVGNSSCSFVNFRKKFLSVLYDGLRAVLRLCLKGKKWLNILKNIKRQGWQSPNQWHTKWLASSR